MVEWRGIPYLFDATNKLPEHFSVMVDKIPQIVVESSFSWDVALSGFLAGCVPAFIAWIALRNSKKDNEKNRMATLNATKKAAFAQTQSERIRKNTDTVATLVAHFMGYCTKILLFVDNKYDSLKYAEIRLELVLIRNKLSILLLPRKTTYVSDLTEKDLEEYLSKFTAKDLQEIAFDSREKLLSQIERLLDITEKYKSNGGECSDKSGEVTKDEIEKEINILVHLSTSYIDEKMTELEGDLL
ncbi:hypothetical protein AC068_06985 [Morganella morganii]|uniref:hypothetical protein n=1 Tax=Morganella morganii TaxID=582 RepID=UPI0006C41787|nr:hypothetical protein [Morganella morganii]KOO19479.1 hypothetical protein AC068_06985 [Morganella morganii]